MVFIQELQNTITSPSFEKIQNVAGDTEITGERTEITYYSDIFE